MRPHRATNSHTLTYTATQTYPPAPGAARGLTWPKLIIFIPSGPSNGRINLGFDFDFLTVLSSGVIM